MPGAMHRMGVYLGLVEDDEFADGEGWDEPRETHTDRAPARRESYADARYSRATKHESAPQRAAVETISRERDVNGYGNDYADHYADPYADHPAASGYQITALHPRTYNEARTIGEAFRANTPVIMNLSEMDDADAKRLVDFAAGLDLRPARAHRAGHRQGVPAQPAQRHRHRAGQGEDRERVLQPVLTPAAGAVRR